MPFSLHQGGVVMSCQIKHTHSHQDTPHQDNLTNNNNNNTIIIHLIELIIWEVI